jgi:hypothetical protein
VDRQVILSSWLDASTEIPNNELIPYLKQEADRAQAVNQFLDGRLTPSDFLDVMESLNTDLDELLEVGESNLKFAINQGLILE